jgi:hypothetical protein
MEKARDDGEPTLDDLRVVGVIVSFGSRSFSPVERST